MKVNNISLQLVLARVAPNPTPPQRSSSRSIEMILRSFSGFSGSTKSVRPSSEANVGLLEKIVSNLGEKWPIPSPADLTDRQKARDDDPPALRTKNGLR